MYANPSTKTGRKLLRLSLLDEELRSRGTPSPARDRPSAGAGAALIEASDLLKDPRALPNPRNYQSPCKPRRMNNCSQF